MTSYTGMSGKIYTLAPQCFAKGGEGEIFAVIGMDNYVAKIYYEKCRTDARKEKIMTMIKKPPAENVINQFTWPVDILYGEKKFYGYIMPRLKNTNKLNEIYSYPKPAGKPWTLYIAVAKNLAAAIHGVHMSGHICGDLNPNNICVNPNTGIVTLVDTDSYHVYDENTGCVYRCEVAMEAYIPNEIQNVDLSKAPLPTFTKQTDLFALGVLIFALLMNGCHPFARSGLIESGSVLKPADNIAEGIFPFVTKNTNVSIPKYAPPISVLNKKLIKLFKNTFIRGYKNPKKRASAVEWHTALTELENSVKTCDKDPSHMYYSKIKECPWCKISDEMKIMTSPRVITQTAFKSGRNVSNIVNDPGGIFNVIEIQLFEGGLTEKTAASAGARGYATVFPIKKVRYIYFQIKFTHTLHNAVNIKINYCVINEMNILVCQDSKPASVDENTSVCRACFNLKANDKWREGKYKLKVDFNSSSVIETDFELVKKLPKPDAVKNTDKKGKLNLLSTVLQWIWAVIIIAFTGIFGLIPISLLCVAFVESNDRRRNLFNILAVISSGVISASYLVIIIIYFYF